MAIFSQVWTTGLVGRGYPFPLVMVALWFVGGCVNLSPPWDKTDAGRASRNAGTAGANTSTGGSSGAGGTTGSLDSSSSGSREPGRESDASGGGTLQPGSSSARSNGKDVDLDGPSAGSGGAGGQPDAGVDAPLSSARSSSSMGGDWDANAPDGKGGVAGSSSQGGTSGPGSSRSSSLGGTSGKTDGGGSSSQGRGGASGTGSGGTSKGSSATGGRGGSSSSSSRAPDAGFDANPLLTGLAVYYQFESATDTTVPDLSGNGRDGTLSIGLPPDGGEAPTGSGYEFVNGKVGRALALHKAGRGYVRVPPEVFVEASELTIALWVNITTEQWWQRILDVGVTPIPYQYCNSDTGTQYFNILPKAASDRLFSISTDGHSNEQALTVSSIPVNTWTHIAVVLPSGGGARLYVNGKEAASNDSLTLRPANLRTIDYAFIGKSRFDADPPFDGIVDAFRVYRFIGKSRFDADPPFDGIVDAFRVYRRALSAAEVMALYSEIPGF